MTKTCVHCVVGAGTREVGGGNDDTSPGRQSSGFLDFDLFKIQAAPASEL